MSAVASTAPAGAATNSCWQRVIADWRDGHIDGSYSPRCLQAALQNMPEDIRIYGSAVEDITRLLTRTAHAAQAATPKPRPAVRHPASPARPSKAKSAPANPSRSLAGRPKTAREVSIQRVAAADTPKTVGDFPLPTVLLIGSVAAAAAVLVSAFVLHVRRRRA